MLNIDTVIGARPQFIKASTISRSIKDHNDCSSTENIIKENIIHTGQHYDKKMSEVFFRELEMPNPDLNLDISNLSHGAMTARMLEQLEKQFISSKPDLVLVYGDTNSTLAAALAASKLMIPIAHVEAGLRSYNNSMPEEINRVVTDRLSNFLFCPSSNSINNLKKEGITDSAFNVGDVMYDAVCIYKDLARKKVKLDRWSIKEKSYALVTIHRQENTDNKDNLESILLGLKEISNQTNVVLPLHPRTKKYIESYKLEGFLDNFSVLEPVSYLEMQRLILSANCVLTDSGGLQKESFFHKVPCITLRGETEWTETVDLGCNILAGSDSMKIYDAYRNLNQDTLDFHSCYGEGNSSRQIINILLENF